MYSEKNVLLSNMFRAMCNSIIQAENKVQFFLIIIERKEKDRWKKTTSFRSGLYEIIEKINHNTFYLEAGSRMVKIPRMPQ